MRRGSWPLRYSLLSFKALGLGYNRATLLIRSIDVGIGFGLLNSVNNFVSGLSLIGERVIIVGHCRSGLTRSARGIGGSS